MDFDLRYQCKCAIIVFMFLGFIVLLCYLPNITTTIESSFQPSNILHLRATTTPTTTPTPIPTIINTSFIIGNLPRNIQ